METCAVITLLKQQVENVKTIILEVANYYSYFSPNYWTQKN